MSSHRMKRPAPISVFSDQRPTKSTIWSSVSCGTQTRVRVPQLFFLGQHALPSVQPKPHLSSGSSAPDKRFVPVQADGWCVPFVEKLPLHSRKTPSASGRTRLAGVPVRHTDPRSALLQPNAASGWQPSLPSCSASVASACVRSVILTDERFLHFQLRQDTCFSTSLDTLPSGTPSAVHLRVHLINFIDVAGVNLRYGRAKDVQSGVTSGKGRVCGF